MTQKLSRPQLEAALARWQTAWNAHDLEQVMDLFDPDVLFETWTGACVRGRECLRRAWTAWFDQHDGFRFTEEDTFIDESEQKVLHRWTLDWKSTEPGHEGHPEQRRGVDILHFSNGRIVEKLTYTKTTVEINGQCVRCQPSQPLKQAEHATAGL